ncbi:MAG: phage tail tape measure protein [Microcoleus sp.]
MTSKVELEVLINGDRAMRAFQAKYTAMFKQLQAANKIDLKLNNSAQVLGDLRKVKAELQQINKLASQTNIRLPRQPAGGSGGGSSKPQGASSSIAKHVKDLREVEKLQKAIASTSVKFAADPNAKMQAKMMQEMVRHAQEMSRIKLKIFDPNARSEAERLAKALNGINLMRIKNEFTGAEKSVKQSMGAMRGYVTSALGNITADLVAFSVRAATAGAGAIVEASGAAIKKNMAVQSDLNAIGTLGDLTPQQLKQIDQTGKEISITYGKTRQEIGGIAIDIAQAGINQSKLNSYLSETVKLSVAARSNADIATASLIKLANNFNLTEKQASDILTQGANRSVSGLTGLGTSLQYSSGGAQKLGISAEQNIALTNILTSSGLEDSRAGTALDAAYRNVQKNPDVFRKLGIEIYDMNGNLKQGIELFEAISDGYEALSDKQKLDLLNKGFDKDGNMVLDLIGKIRKENRARYDEEQKAMQESAGMSEKISQKMLDDPAKKAEILMRKMELLQEKAGQAFAPGVDAAIKFGNEVADALLKNEDLFQEINIAATEFADYLKDNPQLVQETVEFVQELANIIGGTILDLVRDWIRFTTENKTAYEGLLKTITLTANALTGIAGIGRDLVEILFKLINGAAEVAIKIAQWSNPLNSAVASMQAFNSEQEKAKALSTGVSSGFSQGITKGRVIGGGNNEVQISEAQMYQLAALAVAESPTREGRADVAQAVFNRINAGYGADVTEVAFAPGQFEPYFGVNPQQTSTRAGAIAFLRSRGYSEEQAIAALDQSIVDFSDPAMMRNSAQHVGGRTSFKGTSEYGNFNPEEDRLRYERENFYHIDSGQTYDQLAQYQSQAPSAIVIQGAARAANSVPDRVLNSQSSGGSSTSGGTFIRVVKSGQRDENGNELLTTELVANGRVIDRIEAGAVSGRPNAQNFRLPAQSRTGSREPLPEGTYRVGSPEFSQNSFGNQALGGLWVGIEPNQSTERSALGIHVDGDRNAQPGTDGCLGYIRIDDGRRVTDFIDEYKPTELIVDYGLGSVNQQSSGGGSSGSSAPSDISDRAQEAIDRAEAREKKEEVRVAPVPVRTLPGQEYGADRDGGTRIHVGEDLDVGDGQNSVSYLGGEVLEIQDWGEYGFAALIHNAELGVTEIIAEFSHALVAVGDRIAAGTEVGSGANDVAGVSHVEIHEGRGRTHRNLDPLEYYAKVGVDPTTGRVFDGDQEHSYRIASGLREDAETERKRKEEEAKRERERLRDEQRNNEDEVREMQRREAARQREQAAEARQLALQSARTQFEGTDLAPMFDRQMEAMEIDDEFLNDISEAKERLQDLEIQQQRLTADRANEPGMKELLAQYETAIAQEKEYVRTLEERVSARQKLLQDQYAVEDNELEREVTDERAAANATRALKMQELAQREYLSTIDNGAVRAYQESRMAAATAETELSEQVRVGSEEIERQQELLDKYQAAGGDMGARRVVLLQERIASLREDLAGLQEASAIEIQLDLKVARDELDRVVAEMQTGIQQRIGEQQVARLRRNGDEFGARRLEASQQRRSIDEQYSRDRAEIEGFRDTIGSDRTDALLNDRMQQHRLDTEVVTDSLDPLKQMLPDLANGFSNLFTTIFTNFENLGQVTLGILDQLLGKLLEMAAMELFSNLFGAAGGGLLGGSGSADLMSGGGMAIPTAAAGTIGSWGQNLESLPGAIGDAARLERSLSGREPVLAMLNKDEGILNANQMVAYNRTMSSARVPSFANGSIAPISSGMGGGLNYSGGSYVFQGGGMDEATFAAFTRATDEKVHRVVSESWKSAQRPGGTLNTLGRK